VQIPEHIFRGYDMRGRVGPEVTPELVELVGKAYATYLWDKSATKPDVVVGRDLRPSSEEMSEALIAGILSTGADAVDVGAAPTPVVNFSYHHLGKTGVAMVTASHNPSHDNGLKLKRAPQQPICGADLQDVLAIAKSGQFRQGSGKRANASTIPAYIDAIVGRLRPCKGMRVVLDCGNGSGSQTTPELLRALGCEVIEIFCEPDGTFPNHHPDPSVPANMVDLQAKVKETGAAIGFGLDGDGDRLGVVDDEGRFIQADTFARALVREALAQRPGKIVIDVTCTESLAADIELHGGEAVPAKCGYPNLLVKLSEGREYLLGVEVSGHLFFNEPSFDFDDGTLAACKIASYLATTRQSMSSIADDPMLPVRVQTPQIRVPASDATKFEVVDAFGQWLASHGSVKRTDFTDGVKAWISNGWALARAANTAPQIVLRVESSSAQDAEAIVDLVKPKLEALIQTHS